jgi:hypothetical protein
VNRDGDECRRHQGTLCRLGPLLDERCRRLLAAGEAKPAPAKAGGRPATGEIAAAQATGVARSTTGPGRAELRRGQDAMPGSERRAPAAAAKGRGRPSALLETPFTPLSLPQIVKAVRSGIAHDAVTSGCRSALLRV